MTRYMLRYGPSINKSLVRSGDKESDVRSSDLDSE